MAIAVLFACAPKSGTQAPTMSSDVPITAHAIRQASTEAGTGDVNSPFQPDALTFLKSLKIGRLQPHLPDACPAFRYVLMAQR